MYKQKNLKQSITVSVFFPKERSINRIFVKKETEIYRQYCETLMRNKITGYRSNLQIISRRFLSSSFTFSSVLKAEMPRVHPLDIVDPRLSLKLVDVKSKFRSRTRRGETGIWRAPRDSAIYKSRLFY